MATVVVSSVYNMRRVAQVSSSIRSGVAAKLRRVAFWLVGVEGLLLRILLLVRVSIVQGRPLMLRTTNLGIVELL